LKPLGITNYDAKQDPVQWLRCYALSIENAGGNNDTNCLYFPFFLDQAPLTWIESLEKYSIDKCVGHTPRILIQGRMKTDSY
jgi:hypothetical protein